MSDSEYNKQWGTDQIAADLKATSKRKGHHKPPPFLEARLLCYRSAKIPTTTKKKPKNLSLQGSGSPQPLRPVIKEEASSPHGPTLPQERSEAGFFRPTEGCGRGPGRRGQAGGGRAAAAGLPPPSPARPIGSRPRGRPGAPPPTEGKGRAMRREPQPPSPLPASAQPAKASRPRPSPP